jgi:hypothetical protein
MGLGPTDLTFPHDAVNTDTGKLTAWGDTEFARTFGGKRLPWADKEAERIYALIGDLWEIWYVVFDDEPAKASWQARPIGAGVSVVSAGTPDELVSAVIAYVVELPAHINEEREKLRDAGPTWHGYRETHTNRLDALLRLQRARAAMTTA